ncbi:hypothetical protein LCGC14_2870210, partial [marine sediment metagenome]
MGDQSFPFVEGAFGPFAAPTVPASFHTGDNKGQVFYVNASEGGTDDVGTPYPVVDEKISFSTLQGAIDTCVSSRGDTIYVKRNETVTETVTFNKTGIRVIGQSFGMTPRSRGEFQVLLADSTFTDGPVATITSPCYIENIGFASRDTGATFFSGAAALIGGLATALPFGVHLKHCRFPKWGLSNRIGLSVEGSSNCLIEDCEFEGAFASGIYIQGALGHLQIKGCNFNLCTYAITCGSFSDAGVNTQLMIGPGNVTVTP